jgi:hypothetical protein
LECPNDLYKHIVGVFGMRNAMQLKGNKLATVFIDSQNLSTFLAAKNVTMNMFYLIQFFTMIPKWGLPFLYLLHPKGYHEKREKCNYCEV